jgi:hypothetical protein
MVFFCHPNPAILALKPQQHIVEVGSSNLPPRTSRRPGRSDYVVENPQGIYYHISMEDWLSKYSSGKPNAYTRACSIGARILLRAQAGRPLSKRDKQIARLLSETPGVTDRLLDQCLASRRAPRKLATNGPLAK